MGLHVFVFTEALVQNHSLQTAQNLLQEEVAHAEEHSEVCCRNRVLCLCDFTGFGHVRCLKCFMCVSQSKACWGLRLQSLRFSAVIVPTPAG